MNDDDLLHCVVSSDSSLRLGKWVHVTSRTYFPLVKKVKKKKKLSQRWNESYYPAYYLDWLRYVSLALLASLPGAKCVFRKSDILSGAFGVSCDF